MVPIIYFSPRLSANLRRVFDISSDRKNISNFCGVISKLKSLHFCWEKQKIESRQVNYVQVMITVESGCDPKEGEYGVEICGFIGSLDISSVGGVDDISLIKEAIEEHVDISEFPKEGQLEVILKESGEWEDMFWHKYYVVERIARFLC